MAKKKQSPLPVWLVPVSIVVLYLVTHLIGLTKLPVFADESIYIRWSQLIIDDWKQYLFFPMNDGKTPLPMWSMVPFQLLFSDQLWAGRLVSVLVGLGQLFATGWLVKLLGGRQKYQWMSMVLVAVLPFWYFHHRMALTDAWLAFWLTMTSAGVIKVVQLSEAALAKKSHKKIHDVLTKATQLIQNKQLLLYAVFTGLSLGMAFWSKLPAILLLPALPFFIFLPKEMSWKNRFLTLLGVGSSIFLGLLVFASLKLHPAFGQLFNRGGDFLYPFSEVLLHGKWTQTIISWPNYLYYFIEYLTLPVMLLTLYAPFSPQMKRQQLVLLLSAAAFAGPVMLFGIVVFPRYLFPASIFLTVSAVLAFQEISDWAHTLEKLWLRSLVLLLLVLMGANILGRSSIFMTYALSDPDSIPFVASDKIQYLGEWSSGHGILETVQLIKELSKNQTVAVATEGHFGTLPDGILLYFHRTDVSNIYVEGIGQPVRSFPDTFIDRAKTFDRTLLIVNSHRLGLDLPENQLLAEYCRPLPNSPCLQVWDVTEEVSRAAVEQLTETSS